MTTSNFTNTFDVLSERKYEMKHAFLEGNHWLHMELYEPLWGAREIQNITVPARKIKVFVICDDYLT
jgi:hypothetical protein